MSGNYQREPKVLETESEAIIGIDKGLEERVEENQ